MQDTKMQDAIYLYDTLTKNKKIFVPKNEGQLNIYVCGITTYDYCHIGHARIMVFFDILVNYFRHHGYKVNYIRNITDVDDKIIKQAQLNQETPQDLTQRFIQATQEDENALGITAPSQMPLATDYIQQMQQNISTLIEKGYAYHSDNGDVYYSVTTKSDYGKLSGKYIDDLRAGSRVALNPNKKSPLDFALWKKTSPNELGWTSPWSFGRPGWHIECSTMAKHCLGEELDIHGGGNDLIFPHHENEIAQSEAINNKRYAQMWMHTGHVCINDEKMSKSTGNFFTIRQVLKHYSGEVIRLFLLSNHYRTPINYISERLQDSHRSLTRLYNTLWHLKEIEDKNTDIPPIIKNIISEFYAAMNDDFNTPLALAALFSLAKHINIMAKKNLVQAQITVYYLKKLANLLGLLTVTPREFFHQTTTSITSEHIEEIITFRQQARETKNWALADELRDYLSSKGINIHDKNGITTWQKV